MVMRRGQRFHVLPRSGVLTLICRTSSHGSVREPSSRVPALLFSMSGTVETNSQCPPPSRHRPLSCPERTTRRVSLFFSLWQGVKWITVSLPVPRVQGSWSFNDVELDCGVLHVRETDASFNASTTVVLKAICGRLATPTPTAAPTASRTATPTPTPLATSFHYREGCV